MHVHGPSSVPTTPVPLRAAPNPRYNDLTRPRSLGLDSGAERQTVLPLRSRPWDSNSEGRAQFPGLGAVNSEARPVPRVGLSEQDPGSEQVGLPSPWQGSFTLPENDEEIISTAQTWVAQILHESCKNFDDKMVLSYESLVDGRVLCQVVNGIAPGSVESIHQDDSSESNASNICSFLMACRKLGVPKGALFDVDDRDPRHVGLCLHVVSRVVQDTLPEFNGPFISMLNRAEDDWANNNTSSDDDEESSGGLRYRNTDLPQQPEGWQHHLPGLGDILPSIESGEPDRGDINTYPRHHQGFTAVNDTQATVLYPRCPPPLNAAPDPQLGQDLPCPLASPPTSGTSHVSAGSSNSFPISQQRPVSFPSRFSLNALTDDTMWNSLFQSRGGGTGGGSGYAGGGTAAAEIERDQGGRFQVMRHQLSAQDIWPQPAAAAAASSLSSWLSKLNLSAFEEALAYIGVEAMGDLRYVEDQDLRALGMHGPQIRKFQQNRP